MFSGEIITPLVRLNIRENGTIYKNMLQDHEISLLPDSACEQPIFKKDNDHCAKAKLDKENLSPKMWKLWINATKPGLKSNWKPGNTCRGQKSEQHREFVAQTARKEGKHFTWQMSPSYSVLQQVCFCDSKWRTVHLMSNILSLNSTILIARGKYYLHPSLLTGLQL